MKKFVRTLDFYGYDEGCVVKEGSNFTKDDDKLFPISDVIEIKNRKYVLTEDEDSSSDSGDTQTQG